MSFLLVFDADSGLGVAPILADFGLASGRHGRGASPSDGYASKLEELVANPGMMNEKVAAYVEESLLVRARKIADIGLSQREIQIIRLSAEGLKAAEIAERTFLSVHTVNTHRQRIYAKMEVKNVSDMLRRATELGII